MPSPANSSIDLTANWSAGASDSPRLQVSEPDVPDGADQTFTQSLDLPAGRFQIELHYDAVNDRTEGRALHHHTGPFAGLRINGSVHPVTFAPTDGKSWVAQADIELASAQRVALQLSVCATRPLRTRLRTAVDLPVSPRFRAVAPEGGEALLLARGIPFLLAKLDPLFLSADVDLRPRVEIQPWKDGLVLDCGAVAAQRIHFLGMIPSVDIANGSWYSKKGDHGYSHFVGDELGSIELEWADGEKSSVPLVIGFNLWYGRPWDIHWHYAPYGRDAWPNITNTDAEMFGGDAAPRKAIQDAVHLVDAERTFGGLSSNARYLLTLDVQGRKINRIRIKGSPLFHAHPLISGITVETLDASRLRPLPACTSLEPGVNPMTLDYIQKGQWREALFEVQRLLYASAEEAPHLSSPVIPKGYFGPRFDFTGTREAIYAATYLYHNAPECAAHIADSGTGCGSSTARKALSHYNMGMGVWRTVTPLYDGLDDFFAKYQACSPGNLPGLNDAWSRGCGELIREAAAFGYDKFIDSYIEWLDGCLFAGIQPPHWIRCPTTEPKRAVVRRVGNQEENGNRENDGHGICMWGRYMAWYWAGRSREWNELHWKATAAAADWIVWQLETQPLFPGETKDILWTESECANGGYDIYSSYNCLHGLKLSIRMAEQLAKTEEMERWSKAYTRLRVGILNHLVDESPQGPIWHTEPNCCWQDHAHKLVPLHLCTEGDSFTPLQDNAASSDPLDGRFFEISQNSYRYLMREGNYDCLRMYGYGQGMMLQAALLLDAMADAEKFLNLLVTYSHLPHLEGWICPEGIIRHRDGKLYLPVNGYMGQDSHVADATKALRLLLGCDDNDPGHLRLVPRFPASWNHVAVEDFPVLTGASRQSISYRLERTATELRFRYELQRPAESLSVRLGPFQSAPKKIQINGEEPPVSAKKSGDSLWVWVPHLHGKARDILVWI